MLIEACPVAPPLMVTSCISCSCRSPRCLIDIVAPSPNPEPTLLTDFMLVRNLVDVDNKVLTICNKIA